MNLHQFLLILRARYKIALFALVVTVSVTLAVSVLLPSQYTATTTMVLDVKSPDPIAGIMLPAMVLPGYMSTQVDIINSDRVALKVVKMLKLDQSPALIENWTEATEGKGRLDVWLANVLLRKLKIKPSRESSVITIDYTAADPDFAAAIANAFVQAYIVTTIELKVEPAKQYSLWFGEQGKALRDNLEEAQSRLSKYQQKYGIIASDERLDGETARLRELSTQLTTVQAQTSDSRSKQKSGADTLPEIMENALITGLKTDIARREATLQETALNLGRNHPQFQRLESEIASLKQRLEAETQQITRSYSTASTVGQSKEAELRAAIDQQKNKLLSFRNKRDELAVLMRDVEAAQKTYDAVSQRRNQASLESQSTQTNVAVLNPASPPITPSSPKIVLNTLVAIILGTMLGIGAALGIEWSDRRICSAEDLFEMLQLPVLGVIKRANPQAALPYSGSARPRLR